MEWMWYRWLRGGAREGRVRMREQTQELALFFNVTATTEIYTLSLHDALPISRDAPPLICRGDDISNSSRHRRDRKSTRLNSSHITTSYAVFCLKKKNHCVPPMPVDRTE